MKEVQSFETIQRGMSRREMLRKTAFASGGLMLAGAFTTFGRTPAPIMIEMESSAALAFTQKNFFARLFDFRNRFWRGFGAVMLTLAKRATGLEYLNIGPSGNIETLQAANSYAINQSSNGWEVRPGSEIYQHGQDTVSFGMNNMNLGFQDVQARGRSTVSMNPAVLIALTELAEIMRCNCKNLSNADIADFVIPRSVRSETANLMWPSAPYAGEFNSRKGIVRVSQQPIESNYSQNLAGLMVEIRNAWSPREIFIASKNPLVVDYGDINN